MKGKISLGRYNNANDIPLQIHIRLEDDLSGVEFLSIEMSLENLANLITGMGYLDCEFQLRGLDKVGLTREHKIEIIELPDDFRSYEKDVEEKITNILQYYEVDGWIGRRSDVTNGHNRAKGKNAQSVSFTRRVSK